MQALVNEHTVILEAGMTVRSASMSCPGDYDCIRYSIAEINTFELGQVENEIYVGPFMIIYDYGADFHVLTLKDAKRIIDGMDALVNVEV